jgi:acyl-coenzyme A thioesterase PaaI-like protein
MDAAALCEMLNQMVPFNRHLGVQMVEIGAGCAVATLPEADHLHNHIGSQHAAALFAVAEAASGGAIVGALGPERMAGVTPVARRAEIAYLKVSRGPITAVATTREPAAEVLARLDADGRAETAVGVHLTDQRGVVTAQVTVGWHLKKNG